MSFCALAAFTFCTQAANFFALSFHETESFLIFGAPADSLCFSGNPGYLEKFWKHLAVDE